MDRPREIDVRKIVILPTLLTLGNAVCGLAAIAYAGKIGKDGTTPALNELCLLYTSPSPRDS